MAKAIANHLPGPALRGNGYIETRDFIVTSAVGHLLEQAEPDAYNPALKAFPGNLADLPVVPERWIVLAVSDKKAQIALIKKLLKDAPWAVHAGDPDREGQMIVDELFEFIGYRGKVMRVLLPDTEKSTVVREFGRLVDNRQFANRYQAALGRSRADWLIGMNMTRMMTLQGRGRGFGGVLSVGRIQTPTLAIVVRREEEIAGFVAKDFFTVRARCAPSGRTPPERFWARWVPAGVSSDAAFAKDKPPEDRDDEEEEAIEKQAGGGQADGGQAGTAAGAVAGATPGTMANAARPAWLDEANRVIDRLQAERAAGAIRAAGHGTVKAFERREAHEAPPLPFYLDSLSAEMERLHGMSGEATLKACQSLYQSGLQSYPRTDSPYLPESLREQVPGILAAIAQGEPGLAADVARCDPARPSKVWNDAKCKVHYGLVPTGQAPTLASLTEDEARVWRRVALQFVLQFQPDCLADKVSTEIEAGGERLVARGRIVTAPGWRDVFERHAKGPAAGAAAASAAGEAECEDASIPTMQAGERVDIDSVDIDAKRTTPPPRYTEGSLRRVMKRAYTLLPPGDSAGRAKLRASEGIGTAATRIPMIKTLLGRGLLVKKGRHLVPAPISHLLVHAVPALLTSPSLTAQWEMALELVENGRVPLDAFEKKQVEFLKVLFAHATKNPFPPIPPEVFASSARGSGKGGSKGVSATPPPALDGAGTTCPKCGKGTLIVRTVRKAGPNQGKMFLSCSNYPDCKHAVWPK